MKMPVKRKKKSPEDNDVPVATKQRKEKISSHLSRSDFNLDSQDLAVKLLGKCLVREVDGALIKGMIVETESYPGGDDKASCTYNGRRTDRFEALYMEPGTCWVYKTYGVYHCINVSCKGEGAAVFIRAVEPVEGIDVMTANRNWFSKKMPSKALKNQELCNGPSKMCIAFRIDTELNKHDMALGEKMWIEHSEQPENYSVVSCPRIGIDSAGKPAASLPLRFYIFGNQNVSKLDKKREKELGFDID